VHGYLFDFASGPGSRRSLSARGHFLNTFAGIGFSLAFSLLALGSYLIEQEFENPVAAQSAGLLFAALLIATAATLLYCLLHPSRKRPRPCAVWPAGTSREQKTVARCKTATRAKQHSDLPLHGRYVDRTRILIRRQAGIHARGIAGK
jgi:uncharacterized membrane protein YbhN (UPF0104 family)